MKTVSLLLKGVLLWVTTFAVLIFIAGLESIYKHGYFGYGLFVCATLCYTCYKLITKEEFNILTLSRWVDLEEE